MEKEIICKTCFWKWQMDKKNWCSLIEEENGSNYEANRTKCEYYLKKGTEPKWLCCKCGKNTFGESSTSTKGKHYCDNCWWEKEKKENDLRQKEKDEKSIKIISDMLGGDKKKAKQIIYLLKN